MVAMQPVFIARFSLNPSGQIYDTPYTLIICRSDVLNTFL